MASSSKISKLSNISQRIDTFDTGNGNANPNFSKPPYDPEAEYQRRRELYYFHDWSYIHQTVDENGHYKDIIKDYGCGHPNNPKREGQKCWCVPECRFYPEYGRIEEGDESFKRI
jgi:hypothetical protein